MSSRWLLDFGIASASREKVLALLDDVDGAVVAHQDGRDGTSVVTVEVDAEQDRVDEVTRTVRSVDPDAHRLHDTVVVEPPADTVPATVHLDYAADDEPVRCDFCGDWRYEYVEGPEGSVLREWHREDCPTYVAWS